MILSMFRSFVLVLLFASFPALAQDTYRLDIPAQPLTKALQAFAEQSGLSVVHYAKITREKRAPALKGDFTPQAALERLLENSGLTYTYINPRTIEIRPLQSTQAAAQMSVAQSATSSPAESPDVAEASRDIPEIMVEGSKILNMDKPRSRDDAQPYVIFDRATLERSGATNLQDFMKNRLPMETTVASESQISDSTFGNRSSINLRGLGTNQTLILIDGHRMTGAVNTIAQVQPDLNGIPLSAVERIEILPATASGIYGGSATGGVVNVILRRDYVGAEVKAIYANTFDTDFGTRRLELNGGFSLEGGKTDVLLAASYSDGNELLEQDRGFDQRNRETIWANYPDYFLHSILPIADTTNISSADGSDLSLKAAYGGGALGSPFTYVPDNYAGPASDNGAGLLANAGLLNFTSSSGSDVGSRNRAILTSPTVKSVSATIRRQFTPNLQAFVDLGASENTGYFRQGGAIIPYVGLQASDPGNPFDQDVILTFPVFGKSSTFRNQSSDRRGVAGVIMKLPADWQAGADFSYSQSTISTDGTSNDADVTPVIASGDFNVFRDLKVYPFDFSPYDSLPQTLQGPFKSSMADGVARASGPVGTLPGGRPVVSVLIERREEVAHSGFAAGGLIFYPQRSQAVSSAYTEVALPLVGKQNQMPWVQALDLQIAVRRDDYATHGAGTQFDGADPSPEATNKLTSTDPTIGLKWVVTPDFMLRTSYGTGFLPPSIGQLVGTPLSGFLGFFGLVDPRRDGAPIDDGLYIIGGNPDLKPEISETVSAGMVLTPRALPGLRLSIDWIRLDKTDNIIPSLDNQTVLDNESLFPGRVIRGPKLPGDPADWAGPLTVLDVSSFNIARAMTQAVDFQLDYHQDTASFGALDFFAVATRTLHFRTQLFPFSPVVENVGTPFEGGAITQAQAPSYPLKWKGNVGVTWAYGDWTAGWTVRYFDSYMQSPNVPPAVILAQGNGGKIDSQIYHDAFVGYRFGGADLQLNVNNVFNTLPAFDAWALYNGFGDPRLANYQLSLRKSF